MLGMPGRIRAVVIAAGVLGCVALPATAHAEPSPHEGSGPCGQVRVFGTVEEVSAYPTSCDEAMAVATRMVALWPAGQRFVKFDGWSCAGVTAGEASMGDTWDLDCENESTGGKVIFAPPGGLPVDVD
jgi:hypothetical protein